MPVYTNKALGPSNLSARVRVDVRMGQVSSWSLRNEEGVLIVLLWGEVGGAAKRGGPSNIGNLEGSSPQKD